MVRCAPWPSPNGHVLQDLAVTLMDANARHGPPSWQYPTARRSTPSRAGAGLLFRDWPAALVTPMMSRLELPFARPPSTRHSLAVCCRPAGRARAWRPWHGPRRRRAKRVDEPGRPTEHKSRGPAKTSPARWADLADGNRFPLAASPAAQPSTRMAAGNQQPASDGMKASAVYGAHFSGTAGKPFSPYPGAAAWQ